jgi:plastocyanin domain-containing protein
MNIIINGIVISLIAFTVWFFLLKKEGKAVKVKNATTITVDGGYKPDVIEVPVGQPVTLTFVRKDPTSCLEEVVFPNFNIRKFLPMNTPIEITLTPSKKGEFQFHCGMSMYFGKVKAV